MRALNGARFFDVLSAVLNEDGAALVSPGKLFKQPHIPDYWDL
jgi:hypothetical protein